MKASKDLPRPVNWQDFETLCKKLWGEIWDCKEITKNGRNGQNQNGVDICGIPSFDKQYYGIQCKGKDYYTHKKFTEKEIIEEIEKAKKFKPTLKKFYLATTAIKDSKIEEFVRVKNVEHIKTNLFEVHLFSWEVIVELIYENKNTYDYYVNSNDFMVSNSARITFSNNDTEFISNPKFKQKVTFYTNKASIYKNLLNSPMYKMIEKHHRMFSHLSSTGFNSTEYNHSFDSFKIKIHNTGSLPIEDYKIILEIQENVTEINDTNVVKESLMIVLPIIKVIETWFDIKDNIVRITPKNKILVSDDFYVSDEIFFKPKCEKSIITINWKLLSKALNLKEKLTIRVEPNLVKEYEYISIEDGSEERTEMGEIEDYISNSEEEE